MQEWFDYTDNPSDAYEYMPLYANLPEFPNATFRYAGNIGVSDGDASGPRVLISGMPIWNAYFCDLTGDNLPEICATLSIGSGMIDNRIIIYDYANGVSYELEDRGTHDYTLSLQDGKLIVTKRVFNSSTVVETGYLAYLNDTIQIVPLTLALTEPAASTTNASYTYEELSEMPAEELLDLFIQNGLVINDDLKASFTDEELQTLFKENFHLWHTGVSAHSQTMYCDLAEQTKAIFDKITE